MKQKQNESDLNTLSQDSANKTFLFNIQQLVEVQADTAKAARKILGQINYPDNITLVEHDIYEIQQNPAEKIIFLGIHDDCDNPMIHKHSEYIV